MSLLVANHIFKNYGDLDVLENVNVRIEFGDRIGLVGPNGAGKTSLLKALGRLDTSFSGEIFVAQDTRIGYLSQDPPPAGNRTLYEDLKDVFAELLAEGEQLRRLEARMTDPAQSDQELEGLLTRYGQQQEAFERAGGYAIDQRIRFVLTGLGLPESLWHAPLAHLSGGQRTRACLGRLLLEEPDLLFLDEPTNHLDVRSMSWLEGVLMDWKGALIVVSHDRYFLDYCRDSNLGSGASTRGSPTAATTATTGNSGKIAMLAGAKEYDRQQEFISETQDFIRRYKAGQRTKEAQGRETRLNRFLEEEALPPPPTSQFIRLPLRTDLRSGDLVLRTRKAGCRLQCGYITCCAVPPHRYSAERVEGRRPLMAALRQMRTASSFLSAKGPARRRTWPAGSTAAHAQPFPCKTFRFWKRPILICLGGQVAAMIGPNGAGKNDVCSHYS